LSDQSCSSIGRVTQTLQPISIVIEIQLLYPNWTREGYKNPSTETWIATLLSYGFKEWLETAKESKKDREEGNEERK
jgi:hypothetical protein